MAARRGLLCVLLPQCVHAQGKGTVAFMSATGVHTVKTDGTGAMQLTPYMCTDCWGLAVDETLGLVLWTDSAGGTLGLYSVAVGGGTAELRCEAPGHRGFGLGIDPATTMAFTTSFNGRASGWALLGCDYSTTGGSFDPWPDQGNSRTKVYGDHGGDAAVINGQVYVVSNARRANGPSLIKWSTGNPADFTDLTGLPYDDFRIGGLQAQGGTLYFGMAESGGVWPAAIYSYDTQSGGGAAAEMPGASAILPEWCTIRPLQTPALRNNCFAVVGDAPGLVVTADFNKVLLHDTASPGSPTTLYTAGPGEAGDAGLSPVAWFGPTVTPPSVSPSQLPTEAPSQGQATEAPSGTPTGGTDPPTGGAPAPTASPIPGAVPTAPPVVAPSAPPQAAGACPQQPTGGGLDLSSACKPLLIGAACAAACSAGYGAAPGSDSPAIITCPPPGTLTNVPDCIAEPTAAPVPVPTLPPVPPGTPTAPPVVAPTGAPVAGIPPPTASPAQPPTQGVVNTSAPVAASDAPAPPTRAAEESPSSGPDIILILVIAGVVLLVIAVIVMLICANRQLKQQEKEMRELDAVEKKSSFQDGEDCLLVEETDPKEEEEDKKAKEAPKAADDDDDSVAAATLPSGQLKVLIPEALVDPQEPSTPEPCPTPTAHPLVFEYHPGEEVMVAPGLLTAGSAWTPGVIVRCERASDGVHYVVRQANTSQRSPRASPRATVTSSPRQSMRHTMQSVHGRHGGLSGLECDQVLASADQVRRRGDCHDMNQSLTRNGLGSTSPSAKALLPRTHSIRSTAHHREPLRMPTAMSGAGSHSPLRSVASFHFRQQSAAGVPGVSFASEAMAVLGDDGSGSSDRGGSPHYQALELTAGADSMNASVSHMEHTLRAGRRDCDAAIQKGYAHGRSFASQPSAAQSSLANMSASMHSHPASAGSGGERPPASPSSRPLGSPKGQALSPKGRDSLRGKEPIVFSPKPRHDGRHHHGHGHHGPTANGPVAPRRHGHSNSPSAKAVMPPADGGSL
eukprot:TRINITY_DN18443_c0_g1_i1.p1 TRINITY_DN18443_c0_g1~~TRINITY_DN18443_c0_g1_i1.p1  ORF type:complete len:1017 (+),score=147.30 TRINITY_DN18443_c0_g1_i1:104-3154(+)